MNSGPVSGPDWSPHRRILTAVFTVGMFVGLAKVVGAAKEMAVAARFGTSTIVDGYALLSTLVTWPATAWTSAVTAILVPTMIGLSRGPEHEARQFRREFLGFSLWVALVVGAITAGGLWVSVHQDWLHLEPAVQRTVEAILLPMCALTPLIMWSGVLAALLMSGHRHTNSLLEAVTPAVLGLVLLSGVAPGGWALVGGTLLGWAAQVALSMAAQPSGERTLLPVFQMRSPAWAKVLASMRILVISQLIVAAAQVVDQLTAAPLGGSANATLAYANRLTALLVALGATVVSRATLPVLAETRMRDPGGEWRIATRWSAVLFGVGAAALLVGFVSAPLLVRLLFQRGAFTAQDTAAVSTLFRLSLLQLPFYFASMVLAQLVTSRSSFSTFLYANLIALATKVALNLTLVRNLGLNGVMVSTAIMQLVSLVFLFWSSSRFASRRSLEGAPSK